MSVAVIIPSRLAAQRLPEKPLKLIGDIPMVQHVWQQAITANVGPVFVATCSNPIADLIHNLGGKAILTDPNLPSGTDRVWAAFKNQESLKDFDIIVNLQGDLPFIPADYVTLVVEALSNSNADIATLGAPIKSKEELNDQAVVKIAMSHIEDNLGRAHYFSRAAIPVYAAQHYHHIGIYAYRRKSLSRFVTASPSPLEVQEKLEQLRALDLDMRFIVRIVDHAPVSIDTPEDLEKARNLWQQKSLLV